MQWFRVIAKSPAIRRTLLCALAAYPKKAVAFSFDEAGCEFIVEADVTVFNGILTAWDYEVQRLTLAEVEAYLAASAPVPS